MKKNDLRSSLLSSLNDLSLFPEYRHVGLLVTSASAKDINEEKDIFNLHVIG